MMWWHPCHRVGVALLVVFIAPSLEQSCDQAPGFSVYTLSPLPPNIDLPCNEVGSCFPNSPLVDGILGPVGSNFSDDMVHTWSRSAGRVVVTYTLTTLPQPPILHFNLFFYHIPATNIGLPNIELFPKVTSSAPLPYYLTGNQDLSQTDSGRRNVTLSLVNTAQTPTYRIEFDFEDTNIDRLILSEMIVCNQPTTGFRPSEAPAIVTPSPSITLGADNISPNLTLFCSVSGEGRFHWRWTSPDGTSPSEVILSDLTRTSMAVFTAVSNAGMEMSNSIFQCEATYDPEIPNVVVQSGVGSVNVDFQFSLVAASGNTSERARVLDNVTLSCELSGYLSSSGQPQIVWLTVGMSITESTGPFNVTTRPGTAFIQNGGDTPIPSVVSELTIFIQDSSLFQTYFCQARSDGLTTIKIFTVSEGSETTATEATASSGSRFVEPATPATSQSFFQNSTNTVIIAIAIVLLVIILLVVVAIVILFLLRHRSNNKRFLVTSTSRKDSLDYSESYYQDLQKPVPPPLPDHFPELNSDIEAYAVLDHGRMQNGSMEMLDRPLPPVIVRLATEKETSPDHPFLEKNPLYASTDNIDEEKQTARRRRMGSVPSLDVLTDSPTGSQLNIYANPSKIAPPVPARPSTPELESIYSLSEAHIQPNVFKRESMPSPTASSEDQSLPCFSVYADPKPLLRSEGPKEVTPQNIKEIKVLGVGQFGQVLLADTVGLSRQDLGLSDSDNNREVTIQVAVKRLKVSAESHIKVAFEKEIKFMSRLHNENVVRLLGVCALGDMFIIMEYMENGDLNQFLHKRKLVPVEATPRKRGLTSKQLTYLCSQIASGMKYLAAFNFIHRDLATRNCLVGADLNVKIADFGMSRSLYSSDYYRISGRAMLPIRWMANECFYGRFSEKTDVWAFGVTMWEVFTFSREQPYQDMSDQEVIDDAIKGPDRLLLPRPEACPEEVYAVMKQCWIDDPEVRTGFKGAHSSLVALLESGTL